MIDKCLHCGMLFSKTVHNKKYCSNKCMYTARNERIRFTRKPSILTCPICSAEFVKTKNAKFCSKKCAKKDYYNNNSDYVKKKTAEWKEKNYERNLENSRRNYYENYEERRKQQTEYRLRPEISKRVNELKKIKYHTLRGYKVNHALSKSLRKYLITKNRESTHKLLGYSAQELKESLEKQFTSEMNWDNWGPYWHIDHRIPVLWFEISDIEKDKEKIKYCWSIENLQPKIGIENMSKAARYAEPTETQIENPYYREILKKYFYLT